ncbi:MAG: hypothetical protein KDA32_12235 [Phycisphaerales bacterium]|nr:hypothetical protein [Phycisphaerales bacterium]
MRFMFALCLVALGGCMLPALDQQDANPQGGNTSTNPSSGDNQTPQSDPNASDPNTADPNASDPNAVDPNAADPNATPTVDPNDAADPNDFPGTYAGFVTCDSITSGPRSVMVGQNSFVVIDGVTYNIGAKLPELTLEGATVRRTVTNIMSRQDSLVFEYAVTYVGNGTVTGSGRLSLKWLDTQHVQLEEFVFGFGQPGVNCDGILNRR